MSLIQLHQCVSCEGDTFKHEGNLSPLVICFNQIHDEMCLGDKFRKHWDALVALAPQKEGKSRSFYYDFGHGLQHVCLLYTSPSPRDGLLSRMPSSA